MPVYMYFKSIQVNNNLIKSSSETTVGQTVPTCSSESSACSSIGITFFGITRKWVGASGVMSRKAKAWKGNNVSVDVSQQRSLISDIAISTEGHDKWDTSTHRSARITTFRYKLRRVIIFFLQYKWQQLGHWSLYKLYSLVVPSKSVSSLYIMTKY